MPNTTGRIKIPITTQAQVFFRDDWMCHYCAQPTVFAPALKYLAQFIKEAGYPYPTAYHAIQGRYGEPKDRDGFASFFVVYGQKQPERLTAQEKSWLQEIQDYLRLK